MEHQDQSGATFSKPGIVATLVNAARIRDELSDWLRASLALDEEKSSDILLAVNEALANAAEFAYSHTRRPGPMHTHAEYNPQLATLTVTVSDEGVWRLKDVGAHNVARGRGVTLMHALTDRAAIDSTVAGTRVRLQWDHVRARLPRGAPSQSTNH
jgi:anti-sigma regulatory factor (Ser/Thr protein kinase)